MAVSRARALLLLAATALGLLSIASASILFTPVPFPFSNQQKHSSLSSASVVIGNKVSVASNNKYTDGAYQLLTRTGGRVAESGWVHHLSGQLKDKTGAPIKQLSIPVDRTNFTGYVTLSTTEVAYSPDFQSVLEPVKGSGQLHSFMHLESPVPAVMDHIKISQDKATGKLTVTSIGSVDWSAWDGLWVPCAGSVTPWGTHLGSEEGEPDAWAFIREPIERQHVNVLRMARYWGIYPSNYANLDDYFAAIKTKFNPYKYGHATEVSVDANGNAVPKKWFPLGRLGWEMPYAMPDRRTVYNADDAFMGGFHRFVADRDGDLSSGTLYAAKMTQNSASSMTVEWVKIGYATQALLEAELAKGFTFADIFDAQYPVNGSCPDGYKATNRQECLKLKPGMETHAAFFETRRYTAYVGATSEMNKWEGMTYDPKRHRLYVAISTQGGGMVDESATRFVGVDEIKLPPNACGCVYSMDLDPNFKATNMKAVVCGVPTTDFGDGYRCAPDAIANPDNVVMVADDTVWINEDSSQHPNNMLWSYNLVTGELSRVLTTPLSAEVTGSYRYDFNGFTYLWANMQHPSSSTSTGPEGYSGYFGPFKIPAGKTLAFEHQPMPVTVAEKHRTQSSRFYIIGDMQTVSYDIVARSGDRFKSGIVGQMLDKDGKPVYATNSDGTKNMEAAEVSDNPDFIGWERVGDKMYLTAQFEWPIPSALTAIEIEQNQATGDITAVDARDISGDISPWGLWIMCAGSMTPWGSRVGGEEYEPDARALEEATDIKAVSGSVRLQARHYGLYGSDMTLSNVRNAVKPYRYGYTVESRMQADGSAKGGKRLALGRLAWEMLKMLPDNRTGYVGEDGYNVGMYMVKLDKPGDLTAAKIYAMKATQVSAENGGRFTASWIELGHATEAELMPHTGNTTFSNIFATATPNADGTCPAGYKSINSNPRYCECLQVKPGKEKLAAFFETRRYAAYMGATSEWSRWEGVTYNADKNQLYAALTTLGWGMEDNAKNGVADTSLDKCGRNDIKVAFNPCGCVYAFDLDSQMTATSVYGLVCGIPATYNGTVAGNKCHVDSIASPDNVAYIDGHDQLLIGEDTGLHTNDVLWSFDLTTKRLTRIWTTPYGSETTSPYWYTVNGWSYIMAVVQHPYAESDQIRAGDVESFGRAGAIGLVGPFDFGGSKRASTGDLGTGGGDGVVVKSGDSGKKNAGVAAAVAVPISVCAAVIVVAVVAYQVWSKKQAAAGASGDKYAVNGNGKAANTV